MQFGVPMTDLYSQNRKSSEGHKVGKNTEADPYLPNFPIMLKYSGCLLLLTTSCS